MKAGEVYKINGMKYTLVKPKQHRRIDFHKGEFMEPENGWVCEYDHGFDKGYVWMSNEQIKLGIHIETKDEE